MRLSLYIAFGALTVIASTANAQTLSLEALAEKVNERAQTLGGYEDFLMDPDPKRSMAALQVMLESGDQTLVDMALKNGLTSPNPEVRWVALKSYLSGKPTLALHVDGSAVPQDDQSAQNLFDRVLRSYGGTSGADSTGSITIPLGEYNSDIACVTRTVEKDTCAARINATSVSVYLASFDKYVQPRWMDLQLNQEGTLTGSFVGLLDYSGIHRTPPLKATIRLVE